MEWLAGGAGAQLAGTSAILGGRLSRRPAAVLSVWRLKDVSRSVFWSDAGSVSGDETSCAVPGADQMNFASGSGDNAGTSKVTRGCEEGDLSEV